MAAADYPPAELRPCCPDWPYLKKSVIRVRPLRGGGGGGGRVAAVRVWLPREVVLDRGAGPAEAVFTVVDQRSGEIRLVFPSFFRETLLLILLLNHYYYIFKEVFSASHFKYFSRFIVLTSFTPTDPCCFCACTVLRIVVTFAMQLFCRCCS